MTVSRLITALFCICMVCPASASPKEPIRIEISSSWIGLGRPRSSNVVIKGENGKYSLNGRRIAPELIDNLLSALEQPVIDKPSLLECGIGERWLLENYARALRDYTHGNAGNLSPEQVQLFKSHFTDLPSVQTAFGRLYDGWHTDDFPDLTVKVNVGSREFGIQSKSQHPLMLPWFGIDGPRGGYNYGISEAVARLLPKGFCNKDRLMIGDSFRWQITEQIMSMIRHEWNMLDSEHKVGSFIAPVLDRFKLLESAVGNLSSVDLDGTTAWNAELEAPNLPSNLIVGVSLNYRSKNLVGANDFLKQISLYTDLVLSVPWLLKYWDTQPSITFRLRYVNDRSLSLKAQKSLVEDLRIHGKSELADRVLEEGIRSAFLEVNAGSRCWTRAIVFPNREVLLWHFRCDSTLGFPASSFKTWDYYGWRSTGTLFTPEGTPTE